MKNPSLEFFHTSIEKFIRLAQSYTEINDLGFIIRSCRLKPYHYLFEEHSKKVVLYRWWFDEFGNSLIITKNKKLQIIYNDLRLDKDNIITTDLYYGLSIDRIVKMSKLLYLCAGKDEDLYQDCYLLTLLGMDNYLRSYLYWFGEWQQVSPLLTGIKYLHSVSGSVDIKYFRQLKNTKDIPLPCVSGQMWLSCLPAHKDFSYLVKKQYEILVPFMENK